jgi:hypothetical protein
MDALPKTKLTKDEKAQIAREKAREYYIKNRDKILLQRKTQNSGKPRGRPRKSDTLPEPSTTIE